MIFDAEDQVTTITSEDLPALRATMCGYADDELLSAEFRSVCRNVITAIDQARDEDETTHAPLEVALDEFVRAGRSEVLSHSDHRGMWPC